MMEDDNSLVAIAWIICRKEFTEKGFSVLRILIKSKVMSEKEMFQMLRDLIPSFRVPSGVKSKGRSDVKSKVRSDVNSELRSDVTSESPSDVNSELPGDVNLKAPSKEKSKGPSKELKLFMECFEKLNRFLGQQAPKRDIIPLIDDDGLGLIILVNLVKIKNLEDAYDRDRKNAPSKLESSINFNKNLSRYSLRRSIDIDVRGEFFPISDDEVLISIGEIKSSISSNPKAKEQLGLVERIFKYAVPLLYPNIKAEKVLVTKTIYLPKEAKENTNVTPPDGCLLEYV
jgi:hypothetical protein